MTTIVFAVFAGMGVLLAGNLPWVALLAPLNLRLLPVVPWAIVPMAIYLMLYWRYIGGRIGSPESADTRRADLRANPLPPDVWIMAIFTGLVGFAALLALVAVMARLVTLPESAPIVAPTGVPRLTVFLLLVMSSIVAGVTEEAGFRGYMQGRIERRYGLAMGILVNGVMFGLLHFPNHPAAVMSMLPYYIAVAAVYGANLGSQLDPARVGASRRRRHLVIDAALGNGPARVAAVHGGPAPPKGNRCGCVFLPGDGCINRSWRGDSRAVPVAPTPRDE